MREKLLYFEWPPPWHVGWRLSGEGCHWEYDGKNGEFENIDFRFPWLSDTSEMGFGHDVPFLNYSDRLPHPSDLCQPDLRVDIQLISWNVFCYSQLRRLTGSNLLTFFLTYLLIFFLTFFLTFLLTYLLTYLLTFFLTYLLTYLPDISSDISSDIRSDISSDILSDISFDILSDISFDTLSDISSDILSDISFDMLSDIFSDILSDISKPKPNIHSFTKKSRSANSIFTSHHAAKVISMTILCL